MYPTEQNKIKAEDTTLDEVWKIYDLLIDFSLKKIDIHMYWMCKN